MSETPQVAYATDGTDYRGALRYHYASALKRFAKYFVIFGGTYLLMFVTGSSYLLPLGIVGAIGLFITVLFFLSALSWTVRCWLVFRKYPLEFRGPVQKLQQKNHVLVLRLGENGADESPRFSAMDPLPRQGWPKGIGDGFWFAGDDVFGGAALVPGTGELLFMQPRDWRQLSEQRVSAGTDRIKRARRAGIKWRAAIK